jgi:hypothetical protein
MKSSHDVVVSPSITSFSSSIDSKFKPILFDNSFYNQQQLDSWSFKPIKETIVDDVRFYCRFIVVLLFVFLLII